MLTGSASLAGLAALAASGCGDGRDVNAPPWVLSMARQEATKMGEAYPDLTFAACGPTACTVRMNGSFGCRDCTRPPGQPDPQGTRLRLEIDLKSRVVTGLGVGSSE